LIGLQPIIKAGIR